MAVSTLLTYTFTNGLEVLDVGQPDYAFKCEVMVPFGNVGRSLLLGSDTDTVASIVQLTYPGLTLKFGSATPMPTARIRMKDILIDTQVAGKAVPGGSGSVMASDGLYSGALAAADQSTVVSEDDFGRYFRQISDGTIGNDTGHVLTKYVHKRRYDFESLYRFSLQEIEDIRFWCCHPAYLSFADVLSNDEPSMPYVGVRFSTPALDTTFRFMCTDGVTTNNVDSGVTVVADVPYYVHTVADDDATSFTIRILDSVFAELGKTVFTTNMPGQDEGLGAIVAFDPRVAEAMSLKQYKWVVVQ